MGSNGMVVRTRSKGAFWSPLMILGVMLGVFLTLSPDQALAVPTDALIFIDTAGNQLVVPLDANETESQFIPSSRFTGTPQAGDLGGVNLTEPGGLTIFSDLIRAVLGNDPLSGAPGVLVQMCSDGATNCSPNSLFPRLSEDSTPQNVTAYLFPLAGTTNHLTPLFTVLACSDPGCVSAVPEPASLLLLGSGLAGLGLWGRKRFKATS